MTSSSVAIRVMNALSMVCHGILSKASGTAITISSKLVAGIFARAVDSPEESKIQDIRLGGLGWLLS